MKLVIALLFIVTCMPSCYAPRYVYSPVSQNIPFFHRKNDLEVSGAYSGSVNLLKAKGNSNNGIDIQGAWALTNHVAAIFGESARWEKNGSNNSFYPADSSRLSYKRNFFEIGVGYYSAVNYNERMQFQMFGGTALGISDITDDFTSNNTATKKYHNSNITKFFVQPAIIYNPFKNFWSAFSSRFTAVVFNHINTNYTAIELDNYILDSLSVSPVFFWEPGVTYTLGFKKFPLKIKVQGAIAILINHRFVEHRTGNLSLGLIADFAKRRIRQKPGSKN